MHPSLTSESPLSLFAQDVAVIPQVNNPLSSEASEKLDDVKKIVKNCLGENPNIVLTNEISNPYVSCIPGKAILWDQVAFQKEKLATVVFWTVFEQLNFNSQKNVNEIVNKFDCGEITLDNAVEKIESLEHNNSLKAKAVMIAAFANKKLALTTEDLPQIPEDFSLHYRVQQLKLHSHRIAQRLLQSSSQPTESHSYAGTWKIKLDAISEMQKKVLSGLLHLKIDMEKNAQQNSALLKLGCNLVLGDCRQSEEKSISFLQEAAQEIFTPEELSLARIKAEDFLLKP